MADHDKITPADGIDLLGSMITELAAWKTGIVKCLGSRINSTELRLDQLEEIASGCRDVLDRQRRGLEAVEARLDRLEEGTPPQSPEPLPCPFCGKEPSYTHTGFNKEISCDCELTPCVISQADRDDLIQIWNRRA